jgi:translation initiation factor RLI1
MGNLISSFMILKRSWATILGFENDENRRRQSKNKIKNRKKQQNITKTVKEEATTPASYRYPTMTKTLGDFKLHVRGGEFTKSQIIVIQGLKKTGKTTFLRMLVCIYSFLVVSNCLFLRIIMHLHHTFVFLMIRLVICAPML